MNSIVDNVGCLLFQYSNHMKERICQALSYCDHFNDINLMFENLEDPFTILSSAALQNTFIKENFLHVPHEEIPLGNILIRKRKRNEFITCEKTESFVYIPLLKSLQQMLSNKDIAKHVLKQPMISNNYIFYDICGGSIYRNDEFFKRYPEALQLILYHDELEIWNALSSYAGIHKLDMYYYMLGNMSPIFHSKYYAIKLSAIANAKLVKKYRVEKILEPIVEDVNLLYNGYEFNVNGTSKSILGKVILCTGDILGHHLWGGFKEGIGFAFQKCRSCLCDFDSMQRNLFKETFVMRTAHLYNQHCTEIESTSSKAMQNDLCTTYGINKRSALTQFPLFDVARQPSNDVMHILLEGVVQYELRLVLNHLIQDGFFSINELNGSIINHEYGYSETGSKPSC